MSTSKKKLPDIFNSNKGAPSVCPFWGSHGSLQCFYCKRGVNYQNGTTRLPKVRCPENPAE